MTPADRIASILTSHGVDPQTVSLSGPRTLLGEELARLVAEVADDAAIAVHASSARRWEWRCAVVVAAAEARHRRHLARLRWRASMPKHKPYLRAKMEAQRDRLAWRAWAAVQTGRSWLPPEWRVRAFVGPTNTDKDRAPIAGPKGLLP